MLTQGTILAVKAPFEFTSPRTGRVIRTKRGDVFVVTGNGQTHSSVCPPACALLDRSKGAQIGSGSAFPEAAIARWFEVEL